MKRKLIQWTLLAFVLILGACSSDDETSSSAAGDEGGETVIVATGNAYNPFTYLDENGEVAGYDVEVLKAVDEKLDHYQFVYEPYEFKSILTALDSGQARIAAHQFEKNEEREQSYLYGEEPYTLYETYITTLKDSEFDPKTFDDLVDHSVFVAAGTNFSTSLEQYNQENEGQIDLQLGEMSTDVIANEVISGNADATLYTLYDYYNYNEAYGEAFKISEEPVYTTDTYFVFKKGDTELQEAVDQALRELKEEGLLDQLEEEIIIPDDADLK